MFLEGGAVSCGDCVGFGRAAEFAVREDCHAEVGILKVRVVRVWNAVVERRSWKWFDL